MPIKDGHISMYACGMTVYDYAHIGHGRKYTMDDILRRTLEYAGYNVKHVQNVTDVGHLSADEDFGDDKLEKGAEKSGMDVWQTAKYFKDDFYEAMAKLNIETPNIIANATDHIKEQIETIEKILKNGYGYDTPEAVYFDVSKYPDYTNFSGQKLEDKKIAVRDDVDAGQYKKHPADFVLWFKRVGKYKDHVMHWQSPWGDGFPGWHIECSAMSAHFLGDTFDIHTGGVDHIPVHHTNEIAQSYAANGKILANYWFHTDFLMVDKEKMSKSLGNTYRIDDIEKKGFNPLSLRYLYLGANYRSKLNFTWESLAAAETALQKMYSEFLALIDKDEDANPDYIKQFEDALTDNINTPKALAVMWSILKDDSLDTGSRRKTLLKIDEVMGLGLSELQRVEMPSEILALADEREVARSEKNWAKSDELREKIQNLGFEIEDKTKGYNIIKRK